MVRSLLVLIAGTLAFFAVLAGIVALGSMRLRSQWAAAGAPIASSPVSPAQTQPNTAPVEAASAEAQSTTAPAEAATADPASIYLPGEGALLIGKTQLVDQRGKEPKPAEHPKPELLKKHAMHQRHESPSRDNRVWLASWREPGDLARWPISSPIAGKYEVELIYACPSPMGGAFEVEVAGQSLHGKTESTRKPNDFRIITIGIVQLQAGNAELTIQPAEKSAHGLMNLKGVKLVPTS